MKHKKITSITALILLFMFCVFVILYERHAHNEAESQIEKHARVIANSLWNFSPLGAAEYLSLACKTQNYQRIVVTDTEGKVFQKAIGDEPDWREKALSFLHLIPSVRLTSEVLYENEPIGTIEAIWDCTTIYKELSILFILVLFFLISQLYTRLLLSNQVLEERVAIRTHELSSLNDSLLLEVEEHRLAKEALFKSEERYRLMAENIGDVIWIMDMNLQLTYISPSVYQQRGFTVNEAMSQSIEKTVLPDSLEMVRDLFAKTLKLVESGDRMGFQPIKFETRQRCKNGSVIWTSNNARFLPGPNNQPQSILGISHDITKLKIAEKEVQQLSQFRESIIDNANIWLNVLDENGNVVVWNKAAESISGYTKEEVVGHGGVWELFYPDKKYRDQITAKSISIIQNNEIIEGFETTIRRKDGGNRIISWHSRNLIDDDKNPIGSIALGRDITERKLAEKEKVDAQKVAADHKELALVGQIAGKMAHDFNNILGIIMGNTELSLIKCEDSNIRKTLQLIFDQTLRGRNLTKNLVAFAKSQEPKQEFFKIKEKIDFVQSLLKKDLEEIEVLREDETKIPELLADPGMIEHTFVNLILNSIHATSLTQKPRITIRTYSLNKNICFEIEDNGCGIPREHIENIYAPSFTLKGGNDLTGRYKTGIKGTGYGMSNVRKYIQLHRGNISVESELGSGTKFTISLPVIKKELTTKEIDEIQETIGYYRKSILLVEDETAIADVQYKVLTHAPCYHKVDIAVNGEVAMELFSKNDYDFVSLDYILPGDINGMDIYNYIRTTDTDIPIMFVSGNIEFLESIKQLKQKDANIDHISKPCPNKKYINSINQLFEQTSSKF